MLQTFTALAEPNRLRIVELLRAGPQPVGTIGERLRLYQPQVSKHLRVLRDAGLVDVHPRAQQRLYALRSEPLRDLDAWLEHFRSLWDERLSNLERYLVEMQLAESERQPAIAPMTPRPTKRRREKPG
ncbi:MAG: winged helix-turn-helix transcriptional regulator [Gemmatimonadaceae bacterium]|nr:winged helix-turn-helix transcriptional regulator [Gemmatimonadaceae bacterium]